MNTVLLKSFIKKVRDEFTDIMISYKKDEDEYHIFYYGPKYDLNNNHFQSTLGKYIKETFYKNNFYNFYLENLIEEELEDYFGKILYKNTEFRTTVELTELPSLKKRKEILTNKTDQHVSTYNNSNYQYNYNYKLNVEPVQVLFAA